MTMHADQLVGAPVVDSDGQAVGTVEQVFRDDVDGTPSWARIRSVKGLHFVPLAGSSMASGGGLSVPFEAQKIMTEPGVSVDRHMSVEQEEELRKYFGLTVPAQPQTGPEPGQSGQAETGRAGTGLGQDQGQAGAGQPQPGPASPASGTKGPDLAATPPSGTTQPAMTKPAQASGRAQAMGEQEWLVRSEERFAVDVETRESGRVKLRKLVDTEPVQQKVQVFHEEYEIEHVPVARDDKVGADIGERDQEIILHESRAVVTKETVPVERIRLSVKRVEEERTISDRLRKERIEIEGADQPASNSRGEAGRRR
jgi:stress response protein YsnF/sporulation protein YlmC with PRC-barrel domain